MFLASKTEEIPFDIKCAGTNLDMDYMFYDCAKLKRMPKVSNAVPTALSHMFVRDYELEEISDDAVDNWDFSYLQNTSTGQLISNNYVYCYNLRYITPKLLSNVVNKVTANSSSVKPWTVACFQGCYNLLETPNLPWVTLATSAITTNLMDTNCFLNCHRLKRATFQKPNGQPMVVKAKSQTIDLSQQVGYSTSNADVIASWSGTSDNICYGNNTIATVQAKYNEIKGTENWCAGTGNSVTYDGASRNLALLFSRYNHDSAVETIDSLPDASAYLATTTGTNTIKFKNYSGALTDGGGINDLTTEEIAVAAAKGWTVSIVA